MKVDNFSGDESSSPDTAISIPFPKGGIFLLICKTFEQIAYFGTRTLLAMYLTIHLAYSNDDATLIYHTFNVLIFLMSILGAILSDSWLGKYRTILYVSAAYLAGLTSINLSSFTIHNLPARELAIIGLVLIAIGAGALKPSITAFGGDQFRLPQQAEQLALFYSLFYMCFNFSYLCGAAFTPILRHDVQCFGNDHCFPLAFGVPGVFILFALAIFVLGNRWFVKKPTAGNVLVQVSQCIWHAATTRFANRRTDPKPHWLDHSEERFGTQLVSDIKALLNVLVLYLSFPLFWALNEQIGSRWTFQAAAMNGDLGFYHIKPDQMQMIVPVLSLLLVTLWNWLMQPVLNRLGVRLQMKFVIGGVLGAISFVVAGGLELALEPNAAVLAKVGECQVRVFNGQPCDFTMRFENVEGELDLPAFGSYQGNIQTEGSPPINGYAARLASKSIACQSVDFTMNLSSGSAMSYFVSATNEVTEYVDSPKKDVAGKATLRILVSSLVNETLRVTNNITGDLVLHSSPGTQPLFLTPSTYVVTFQNQNILPWANITLDYSGVYTLLLNKQHSTSTLITISPPSTISVLWILPQYVIMTLGEALFLITCIHFAYTEAPVSMKTVAQAIWLFTISLGNLIDVIIVSLKAFDSQAHEFFLFAGLMLADCVLMAWLANRFRSMKKE